MPLTARMMTGRQQYFVGFVNVKSIKEPLSEFVEEVTMRHRSGEHREGELHRSLLIIALMRMS